LQASQEKKIWKKLKNEKDREREKEKKKKKKKKNKKRKKQKKKKKKKKKKKDIPKSSSRRVYNKCSLKRKKIEERNVV